MSFISDKLAPLINVSKYALNHFWVYSGAKDNLRSAKNVAFSLFCILVGRPMEGYSIPSLPGYVSD